MTSGDKYVNTTTKQIYLLKTWGNGSVSLVGLTTSNRVVSLEDFQKNYEKVN